MAGTATRPRRGNIPAEKAIIPTSLTADDLQALLGGIGEIATGGEFHRMKLNGGVLETDDGEMFPPQKDGPAVTLRIVKPTVYYNAHFLTENPKDGEGGFDARRLNRGDLNGRFARKYDDPAEQAADTNPANDLYDEIVALTGSRGAFKADLKVQIVPPSGIMTGEETTYTLSLSTTSIFEWRGTSRDPMGGQVSDDNFMVRLANLAVGQAIEAGQDEDGQKRAVIAAVTALRTGDVIAEVYPERDENDKKTRTWWVLKFVPVYIGYAAQNPELPSGDDVPF